MAAIDVGAAALVRGDDGYNGWTALDLANPADGTGLITSFEVWVEAGGASNVKLGTMENTAGDNFTPRDYELIASIAGGSKQTESGLTCAVTLGDFAGWYCANESVRFDTAGGSGNYRISGDQWGAGDQDYGALQANRAISVYGIGTTAVAHTKELSDLVAIADSISKLPGLFRAEVAVAISDAITSKTIGVFKTETVAVADSFSKVSTFVRAIADTVTTADAVAKTFSTIRADTIAIADSIVTLRGLGKILADTMAIADTITTKAIGVFKTDTVALADSFSKVSTFIRTISDTVSISDSFSKVSKFFRTIADTVAISDTFSKVSEFFRSITDTIAISDAIHAAMHWTNLTLEPRSVALTLKSRSLSLTLKKRK